MKSITANLNSGAGERTGKKRRGRPPGTRKFNSSDGDAAAVHQPGPSTQDDCLINNSTPYVKRKRGRPPSKKSLSLISPAVETQNLDGEIGGDQQHPTPTSNEGTDISHQPSSNHEPIVKRKRGRPCSESSSSCVCCCAVYCVGVYSLYECYNLWFLMCVDRFIALLL
jgi:hypothetical protein